MLYAFGFERVGVLVGDLYFVDPRPAKGQEGAEHGVRVELRVLERGALKGSICSAQPIEAAYLADPAAGSRRSPGRLSTWPVTRRDG